MSISITLELHHGFHAQIYMGSNHVPFLLPGLISGIIILGIGSYVISQYGLIALVLTQLLVQLSFNNWYPVYLNLKLLDWGLSDYFLTIFSKKNFGLEWIKFIIMFSVIYLIPHILVKDI